VTIPTDPTSQNLIDGACAECARQGTCCCEVVEGEKLATLSFRDVRRIEEATGLAEHRFVEREQLDPVERLAYETFRPLLRGLFVGNVRLGLKPRRGACVFLERGRGCRLPPGAKPLACRLYPFDYNLAGELTLVDAPHCLAINTACSERELLRMFGTSRRQLRSLRKQTLEEATEHARLMRQRAG
jgi:Fe-S-cluster containining protein